MTSPSDDSSPAPAADPEVVDVPPDGPPAAPAPEPTIHAVLVAYEDCKVSLLSGPRDEVVAAAGARIDAGEVEKVFIFRGDHIPTTTPPIRAVFGPGDVVPLLPSPAPEVVIDPEGRVDPDSLGPPPVPAAGPVPTPSPAAPAASAFDEFDDPL